VVTADEQLWLMSAVDNSVTATKLELNTFQTYCASFQQSVCPCKAPVEHFEAAAKVPRQVQPQPRHASAVFSLCIVDNVHAQPYLIS